LCHLTYEDASFDLVITSETLEHVPDLDVALAEIHRVLAPGGHHVFTIPLLPGVEKTYPRARLDEDGNLVPLVEPRIAHPGGDWGYPVFTEFGADLPAILDRAGFDVTLHFGPPTEDNLTQVWVATRRPD
jgi:ubiquinone/menaquinone biosynthesis C-methylase UbiE